MITLSPVSRSVPYDDAAANPQLVATDVQSAIDALKGGAGAGPPGISVSAVSTTTTTSTSYVALNSMSVSTTAAGNWSVIFTAQMNAAAGADVGVEIFVGGVALTSSERIGAGASGTHNFALVTSDKIIGAALGAVVDVRWKSVAGGTSTCTGRNLTIVKVT